MLLHMVRRRRQGTDRAGLLARLEMTRHSLALEVCPERELAPPAGASHGVWALDIDAAEGRYLLSGGGDRYIAIHDGAGRGTAAAGVAHGQPRTPCTLVAQLPVRSPHAHARSIETLQWFPHDTGMFSSSCLGGVLKLWDTNRLVPVRSLALGDTVYQHALSPIPSGAPTIAVATNQTTITLCDVRSGSSAHLLRAHTDSVLTVAWCPESEWILASGGKDCRVLLWDVRSSAGPLHNLDQHNGLHGSDFQTVATAHEGWVNGLRFSRDGRSLVSSGRDSRMRLWDLHAGACNTMVYYPCVRNHHRKKLLLGLSSGGLEILFHPCAQDVHMYDLYSGSRLRVLRGHYNTVHSCVFHPHREELYTGSNDPQVFLWTPRQTQVAAHDVQLDVDEWSDAEEDTL